VYKLLSLLPTHYHSTTYLQNLISLQLPRSNRSSSLISVEEIHSVGTINNVETSVFSCVK